jgi:putative glutathione S-transferase
VNNESSELIRIFNQDLNDFLSAEKAVIDIYPKDLRPQIEELNAWIYYGISSKSHVFLHRLFSMANPHLHIDGVYRSGRATTQTAYETAVVEVFDALDKVEKLLTGKEYLVGDKLTEADVKLWVTIVCLKISTIAFGSLFGVNLLDSVRSCLCWSFQMQFPHNP